MMYKKVMKNIVFIVIVFLFFPVSVLAESNQNFSQRFSGYILLDVERTGAAWYVFPGNQKRYSLGRPKDAYSVMKELSVNVTSSKIESIKLGELPRNLIGSVLTDIDKPNKSYYLNPRDNKLYNLNNSDDVWQIMVTAGLGIKHHQLATIHKPGIDESINAYSSYYKDIITLDNDSRFRIDVIEVNLANPRLKIFTDTANNTECKNNCNANYLANYVLDNNGFAGVVGTYFQAGGPQNNYYFFPVYNSSENIMINKDKLKYKSTGPVMVFTNNNDVYYFENSQDFMAKLFFDETETPFLILEDNTHELIQAVIGNKPVLLETDGYYENILKLEPKEMDKTSRIALAYRDNKIYIIFTRSSSILDLNDILEKMDMEFAVNLDAGASSALYYNDEYVIGPGRRTPNAIVFGENVNERAQILGTKIFSINSGFVLFSF